MRTTSTVKLLRGSLRKKHLNPVTMAPLPLRWSISYLPNLLLSTQLIVFSLLLVMQANAEPTEILFERDIRPIFRAHCFDCHGATEQVEAGLDLRLVRFMTTGGDSGPAIEPSDASNSLLIERIESEEMPPGDAKVSDAELRTLKQWIDAGSPTARPEPESLPPGLGITPEERGFWSFQPINSLTRDELREVVSDTITTNDLDKQYLLETAEKLADAYKANSNTDRTNIELRDTLIQSAHSSLIAEQAPRGTLIRRAYYDLLGLPPSPAEFQKWNQQAAEDWYESMLDELLQSPRYGERWGRHWLDVAGYADSEGYTTSDAIRPWAWRYRDWVVKSFNDDKPFDQFIIEQLAGDELAGPLEGDLSPQQIELLTATGYLRMAADGTGSGANTPEGRNQVVADTLKIVGTSLLGMSIQCAQCHDHRYDPIPQQDYYALRAVFEPAMNWQAWKVPAARKRSLYTQENREQAAAIESEAQVVAEEKKKQLDQYMEQALTQELSKQPEGLRESLRKAYETPAKNRDEEQKSLLMKHPSVNITAGNLYQYIPDSKPKLAEYDKQITEIRSKKPVEEFIRALIEPNGNPPETKLFHRGDYQQPKQVVTPAALQVACPDHQLVRFDQNDQSLSTSGRRLAFAKWVTSQNNPLFTRVIANRIWLHHFGKGIVDTPGDFGQLGSRPSNPKLLDWVANVIKSNDWHLKSVHRIIMSSRLYRQDRSKQRANQIDASTRDSAHLQEMLEPFTFQFAELARLDAEVIRDSILAVSGQLDHSLGGAPINIKEDATGLILVEGASSRRSLYIQARRTKPVSMLQTFDAPVMETNCEVRVNSTVATQSLMMLNSHFILDQAANLADRAAKESKQSDYPITLDLPAITRPADSQWSYGYGLAEDSTGFTKLFEPLPHWNGSQWQGGPELPDPKLGWALLNRSGGHPETNDRSVIRRWTANQPVTIRIRGSLSHQSPHGDGVRGKIISSRHGLHGNWLVKQGSHETNVAEFTIKNGDQIDFITESTDTNTSDSFTWPVSLTVTSADQTTIISSESAFRGPSESVAEIPGQIYHAWNLVYQRNPSEEEMVLAINFISNQIKILESQTNAVPGQRGILRQCMTNLCQMLLSSNEFLYVE